MILPYLEITEPGFAPAAAATFTIDSYGAGVQLLRGPCPRCSAVIDIPVVVEVVKGAGRPGQPAGEPAEEPVICTCGEKHDGRPADRVGCGAYWNFVL